MDTGEVTVAARVSKKLYERILKRQRDVQRLTGVSPSVSAVLRAIIEDGTKKKR